MKARILIADADHAAAEYQSALAALDSPEFSVVATAEAAVEELRGGAFDLLIADVDVARGAGHELLQLARQVDPELPMIAVTRSPTVESATTSLRLGAGDYLARPIDRETLVESARRLLGSRRREAAYELLRRQVERPY